MDTENKLNKVVMNITQIKQTAEQLYQYLQPYCIAIYLGGSLCEGIIKNSHDVDFICFSDIPREMCNIRRGIHFFLKERNLPENYDFIQVRTKQKEEHAYGSYINKKMIKLVGEEINFEFDVIDKHRAEYIEILKNAADRLTSNKILNQKR
jgi:hypothetical protein